MMPPPPRHWLLITAAAVMLALFLLGGDPEPAPTPDVAPIVDFAPNYTEEELAAMGALTQRDVPALTDEMWCRLLGDRTMECGMMPTPGAEAAELARCEAAFALMQQSAELCLAGSRETTNRLAACETEVGAMAPKPLRTAKGVGDTYTPADYHKWLVAATADLQVVEDAFARLGQVAVYELLKRGRLLATAEVARRAAPAAKKPAVKTPTKKATRR